MNAEMIKEKTGISLSIMVAIITTMIALAGFAFNIATKVYSIDEHLDRNCRILLQLDQDIRFHAIREEKRKRRSPTYPFPQVEC